MLVQIGLPVKNGEKNLSRALASLLDQSHSNIQILVSNNGSTDQTLAIARDFALRDPRVRVLDGERGGQLDNFAFVLEQSSAPVFMWAAHDDMWGPNFVSNGLSAIKSGYDYFMPQWWAGDIHEGKGWTPNGHPLSFISDDEPYRRVIQLLNLRHDVLPDNMLYSIFRSEPLKACFFEWFSRTRFPSERELSGFFNAVICASMRGVTSETIMFFKDTPWHASLAPLKAIYTTPLGLPTDKKGTSRLLRFKQRKNVSQSLQIDGLIHLVIEFPELANSLFRIFFEQSLTVGEHYLVQDMDELMLYAFEELNTWPLETRLKPSGNV
jgi:hypothetical protein